MLKFTERYDYQREILDYLTENNGFIERKAKTDYDAAYAMDRGMLFKFLEDTQPEAIAALRKIYGGATERTIIGSINNEATKRKSSMIETLKRGVSISNIHLDLMYGKPATSFNPELSKKYSQNIFSVMEEVYASALERVDLVIFLNGIAIAAIELKLNFSGRTYRDAIKQFREDRNPNTRLFMFKVGAFVFFAMDTSEVYMTTRIEGEATFFRPFNKGRVLHGGVIAEAGNPDPAPDDFAVSYMWKEILTRDSLIELITRFVVVERKEEKDEEAGTVKIRENIVFPRFHQIDVIRRLLGDVYDNRTAQNYLIQHSAGSGKTYSIAWLAHRLVSAHDADDKVIFDTVIIMTDRIVVDRQLQNAVTSIEHKSGLIKVMDNGCTSADLGKALSGNTKIIATTLQKFRFVLDVVRGLSEKNFAVIIDEAHSSTAGSSMMAVSKALGSANDDRERDLEETIIEEVRKHGKQKNVSMFAITATPKPTTLELFGRKNEHGQAVAFHLYSMQQAIQEGYILDVLENYIEYQTYYELNKKIEDDPEIKTRDAKRQIARFVTLHPTNVAQRVEVIIEHFRTTVKDELGGKAKAMIVTSSREEAVKYYKAVGEYVARKGYGDVRALAAFTGAVKIAEDDGTEVEYTEQGINGFTEDRLPEKFDKENYNVLLVANKYQTGFDQPKLCAMYILKRLKGVAAVQTLSRLNRICKPYDKKTFILDFVNSAEQIAAEFSKYYTVTMLSSSVTPDDIYDIEARIDAYAVIDPDDVETLNEMLYKKDHTIKEKKKINFCLEKTHKLLGSHDVSKQREFKMEVHKFIRYYEFLIQATCFGDPELHKKYNFLRYLYAYLSIDAPGEGFSLEGKIVATNFAQKKVKETVDTPIVSNPITKLPMAEMFGFTEEKRDALSKIIEQINTRIAKKFDIDVASMHVLQILKLIMNSDKLKTAAKNNTEKDFELTFFDSIDAPALENREQNEGFSDMILNDEDIKKEIFGPYAATVWQMLRESA